MPVAEKAAEEKADTTPHSNLAGFLIEAHYRAMGCDTWNTRRVQMLMAKLGDTATMIAARMRLRPSEFNRRMEHDCWTRQDGLVLTVLEREIDATRGIMPKGPLCP